MILRARTVLTGTGPALDDAGIWIEGGLVARVGPWAEVRRAATGEALDLGESIVIPGLINAHCHLEYTGLAGLIPPPKAFPDWIKAMAAARRSLRPAEALAAWKAGAAQALATGTTLVVNIEATPEIVGEARRSTPLRVVSHFETRGLGLRGDAGESLQTALSAALEVEAASPGAAGLAPHSPYSTTSELLGLAARSALERRWLVSTHIAESKEEFDMFMFRRGPMYDWLAPQRRMDDCGRGSPVRHCDDAGLFAAPCLAAHVNHLWQGDADLLARRGVVAVHCPRSHAFFRRPRFPREALEAAGVRICLGTDSLASARGAGGRPPVLSLFDEMQALAAADSMVSPSEILAMATVRPAAALGLAPLAGRLAEGSWADLAALPDPGGRQDPAEAVVRHPGPVRGVMIRGVWETGAWAEPVR